MKLIYRLTPLLAAALLSSCHSQREAARYADDVYYSEAPSRPGKPGKPGSMSHGEEPAKGAAGRVVNEARRWLGTPYRYGGHDRGGTDCSGMVMEVYLEATGMKLPRTVAEQSQWCRRCDMGKTRPGDLVFFRGRRRGKTEHVGIYVGDGQFIHSSTSRGVIVSRMDEPYWQSHYEHSGRALD